MADRWYCSRCGAPVSAAPTFDPRYSLAGPHGSCTRGTPAVTDQGAALRAIAAREAEKDAKAARRG